MIADEANPGANPLGFVHQWSQIWKKNPNLENILRIRVVERANFAIWNCQVASRHGEIEVDN
jgi:hypothetical protein